MPEGLFIFAVDNPTDFRSVHTLSINLDLFVLSSKANNLKINFLSNSKKISDLASERPMVLSKIYEQKSAVLNGSNFFKDDDILLFVDAYDVIFNKNSSELLVKNFKEYGCSILLGAEKTAWPNENKIFDLDLELGKNRYPNSGLVIGYFKYFKKIFNENSIEEEKDDQVFWGKMYAKYRAENLIKIDHKQKLVQNDIYDYLDTDVFIAPILHANGYSNSISKRDCLEQVFRKIYSSISRPIDLPIFLINLNLRQDRLVNSLRVWGRLGLYPIRIPAIESNKVNQIMNSHYSNTNLDSIYKPDEWRSVKKQKDIMCAISLSHIQAFELAKSLELDKVIVAQDDLIIHRDMINIIKSFDSIDYEAVQFECVHTDQQINIEDFNKWPCHALIGRDCFLSGTTLESAILHTKNSINYFLEEDLKMKQNKRNFEITETLSFYRQSISKKWYTHFPFLALQKNQESDQFSSFNQNHLSKLKAITDLYLSHFGDQYIK